MRLVPFIVVLLALAACEAERVPDARVLAVRFEPPEAYVPTQDDGPLIDTTYLIVDRHNFPIDDTGVAGGRLDSYSGPAVPWINGDRPAPGTAVPLLQPQLNPPWLDAPERLVIRDLGVRRAPKAFSLPVPNLSALPGLPADGQLVRTFVLLFDPSIALEADPIGTDAQGALLGRILTSPGVVRYGVPLTYSRAAGLNRNPGFARIRAAPAASAERELPPSVVPCDEGLRVRTNDLPVTFTAEPTDPDADATAVTWYTLDGARPGREVSFSLPVLAESDRRAPNGRRRPPDAYPLHAVVVDGRGGLAFRTVCVVITR